MTLFYFNKYIKNTQLLLLSTISLATILIISSLSFLVQINIIQDADATIESSNTTITSDPASITVLPPVEQKTGQPVLPPPKTFIEKDPITGQTEVTDIITRDPIIESEKIQKTTVTDEDQNLDLGLNLDDFKDELEEDGQVFDSSRNTKFLKGALGLDLLDVGIPNTEATKSAPTFNPFFRECNTAVSDVAKYSITGKLDNLRIKDNDFSLNIFADLIFNDAYQFNKNDKTYPYNANFVVDGDTDDAITVDLKQFNTNCIDLVTISDPENALVDLERSLALKELGFDS